MESELIEEAERLGVEIDKAILVKIKSIYKERIFLKVDGFRKRFIESNNIL